MGLFKDKKNEVQKFRKIDNETTEVENSPMKDMIVRNNFIKDVHVKRVTGGTGIGVSGQNRDDQP